LLANCCLERAICPSCKMPFASAFTNRYKAKAALLAMVHEAFPAVNREYASGN